MPSVSKETQELPAAAGEQEEEEEWDEVVGALHERRAQKREVQQLRRANKMLQHQVAQLRQSVSVTAAPHVRCLCQRRSRGHIDDVYSAVTLQVADLRALTADGGVGAAEQTMAELRSSLQAAEATAAEQRELLLTAQAEEAVADSRENDARNTAVSALNEEVILLRSQLTETSRTTGSMQQEQVSRHPRRQ